MDIEKLAGTTLGNYEVESLLGRGGMGVVYKARQISLNRVVALKILPPTFSSDSSFVIRFQREAHSVARLNHPNISQIYDIDEENGIHFFSMEFMEGQTLELSRISWHLLENQEATARRFSHELHDELGQSLTAVKANLATLGPNLDVSSERVQECAELVDHSIENVREMSRLLHPRVLDDFGLDAALRALMERHMNRTGIEVDYECNFDRRIPMDTATHLYRVAQEALTNVVKHSRATRAHVRLWRDGDEVTLCVRDNGVGLTDAEREGRGEGLGLVGMAARAGHLGGALRLDANPEGGGLLVEVRVPVKGEYEHEQDPHPAG